MPPTYFDTSALVKRYVAEVGSAWVRRALAQPSSDPIYTSVLTQPEVLSALQRKVREGQLEQYRAQVLTQRVTMHITHRYRLIEVTASVVTEACRCLQVHPLRAYDALQLASATVLRDRLQRSNLAEPRFVAADDALLTAATAEGFVVDNPLRHP
jgi:predicted nucleic acid-binding protein